MKDVRVFSMANDFSKEFVENARGVAAIRLGRSPTPIELYYECLRIHCAGIQEGREVGFFAFVWWNIYDTNRVWRQKMTDTEYAEPYDAWAWRDEALVVMNETRLDQLANDDAKDQHPKSGSSDAKP